MLIPMNALLRTISSAIRSGGRTLWLAAVAIVLVVPASVWAQQATPAPQPAAPAAPVSVAAQPTGQAQAADPALAETLARMERMLTGEVRALRTLVEMLVDKGLIDREEYVRRVRGK